MSDFENKWISPSSIKKEVDKARMAEQKAEEERNKKNQQLWDDLTDEEKKILHLQ